MIVRRNRLGIALEPTHLRRLLKFLEIDLVLDVGANVGQYATMLRKKARYRGRIVSFEPAPALIGPLQAKADRDPLWSVEQIALADTDGTSNLNLLAASEMNSISAPDMTNTPTLDWLKTRIGVVQVRTERLVAVLDRLGDLYGANRIFLKMDTQGYDFKILGAAQGDLGRLAGIQTEMTIQPLYQDTSPLVDVVPFLQKRGFVLSAIVPNNAGHFPELIETDGIFIRSDLVRLARPV